MIAGKLPKKMVAKIATAGGDDCWPWLGAKDADGYGIGWSGSKTVRVHRFVMEQIDGKIGIGSVVLHKCDNPSCCNPAHLSVGSVQENVADRDTKGRRSPPKGESHKSSKITEKQANEIRASKLPERELGKIYGISKTQAGDIRRGKYWA